MIRCLVADDHEVVRLGLEAVLNRTDGVAFTTSTNRASEILPLVEEFRPNIVITDLRFRDGTGIQISRDINERYPDVHVIFHTAFVEPLLIQQAAASAARGFVLKHAPVEELIRAIFTAIEGRMYIDGTVAAEFLKADVPGSISLSDREQEVLQMLSNGYTMTRISQRMYLAPSTIAGYAHSAQEKLHADTRTQAVAEAIRRKLLE